MLDDILREVITSRFKKSRLANRTFSGGGFLNSASAKIDLAYLMHAIDKQAMTTLKAVAKIRNVFAHNICATFTMESKELTEGFAALNLHVGRTTYIGMSGEDTEFPFGIIDTRRRIFEVNIQLLLPQISEDLYGRHFSNSSIPFDVFGEMSRIFKALD